MRPPIGRPTSRHPVLSLVPWLIVAGCEGGGDPAAPALDDGLDAVPPPAGDASRSPADAPPSLDAARDAAFPWPPPEPIHPESVEERWRRQFEIVPLATLGGDDLWVVGISEAGLIVGTTTDTRRANHPVFWRDGVLHDLGIPPGFHDAWANGFNSRGDVVGLASMQNPGPPLGRPGHAFLWRTGTAIDLGTLGGPASEARAISDAGVIVGTAQDKDGVFHCAMWEGGPPAIDLGTLGGDCFARAINAVGQVVGHFDSGDCDGSPVPCSRAFLWQNGVMTELATLGRNHAIAWAINAHGDIAGSSGGHAVVWRRDGTLIDLAGTGAVSAQQLDACGGAAGYGYPGAFVWQSETLVRLPDWDQRVCLDRSGRLVGSLWKWSDGAHPLMWVAGQITVLPKLGRGRVPVAVNVRGDIVMASPHVDGPFPLALVRPRVPDALPSGPCAVE